MTVQNVPSSERNRLAYSPGLEGVVAGETAICQVDPSGILLYRGYDIHELATRARFEEVVWLLLRGELPGAEGFEEARRELAAAGRLPGEVIAMLRLVPRAAHPIDVLRTGVSMLAAFDDELNDHSHEANGRKAVRLVGLTGALVAAGWRISRGETPANGADDGRTYSERFLAALWGAEPPAWQVGALDTILALYAEHEFNASTFAARVTASTMSDVYAAVTAALGTLKGPLHGGANEEAMRVLREVGAPERAGEWVRRKLAAREKVMGFGHRIYRTGDSRVPVMRELARRIGRIVGQPQWVVICEALEAEMGAAKGLCANVDLYAAPVLHMMGLPAALNTPVFACARVAGWCAHVIEQHDHNRLIRPRSFYTGPARREYPAAAATAGGV